MPKPNRPPDALLDVAALKKLPPEEQDRLIDEFIEHIKGEPKPSHSSKPVKPRTKPKGR